MPQKINCTQKSSTWENLAIEGFSWNYPIKTKLTKKCNAAGYRNSRWTGGIFSGMSGTDFPPL